MKKLILWLLCCTAVFAEEAAPEQLFDWNLFWSGQWVPSSSSSSGKIITNGNLHNRTEMKFFFLPLGLFIRGQVLDRRPIELKTEPGINWFKAQDSDKAVTHFQGGLYHKETGSRLLYGVLDEKGLSARIRNPWIRSPPYAENHAPMIADLKTTVSSTKNDEAYLFLSTPPSYKASGFVSAQTEADIEDGKEQYSQTAVAAGLEIDLPKDYSLSLETFYTWALLEPKKANSWFSNPPPLPERNFALYAAGIIFDSPLFSISSDYALSDTFAWGTDIYTNLGISISPMGPWSTARIKRPLTISFAADGSGNRFVNRDGSNLGTAFRSAAKIEIKRPSNSLLKFSTVLRSPEPGEGFTRSQINFYYRFPAIRKDERLVKLTRISISADRNADNNEKIIDRLYGYIGFSLNLTQFGVKNPVGMYFNGSIRGITAAEDTVSAYPVPKKAWDYENHDIYGEISYSPSPYQFKTMLGYSNNAKNNKIWDCSFSGAMRFKQKSSNGRVSLKAASPKLPNKWNFSISWYLEVK